MLNALEKQFCEGRNIHPQEYYKLKTSVVIWNAKHNSSQNSVSGFMKQVIEEGGMRTVKNEAEIEAMIEFWKTYGIISK